MSAPNVYKRILVGTDGSDSASLAVAHALYLAQVLDASVTVVAVYMPAGGESRAPGTRLTLDEARAVLGDAVQSSLPLLAREPVDAPASPVGSPDWGVPETPGDPIRNDLDRRRPTANRSSSSPASFEARTSSTEDPLLDEDRRRIAGPVDESGDATSRRAGTLPARHLRPEPEGREQLATSEGRVRTRAVVGPVHRALRAVAAGEGSDLLVVGSRREGTRPGPALIRMLLENPPCDVLVVDTVGGRRPSYRRIGNLSSGGAERLSVAVRMAAALDSELVALEGALVGNASASPEGAEASLREPGRTPASGAPQGMPPVGAAADLSQSAGYDLLVVGRASAGNRMRAGRLAREIEAARTNVLVVSPPGDVVGPSRRDRTGKEPRMARGGPDALIDVPLFAGLSKRHLRHIAGLTEEEQFPEGTSLAEEGNPGDSFYVLLEGEAKVVRGGRRIDRLIPGDFFGEIALIDGGPRTATVIATTPVSTLTISRRRFRKMLEEDSSIVLAMLEELAKRLRNNERSVTG